MKTKHSVGWVVLLLALVVGLVAWWLLRSERALPPVAKPRPTPPAQTRSDTPRPEPAQPRRTRAMDDVSADRDVIDGRVLDGVTHEGVANAELTFLGDGGAATFQTSSDGTFLLTPPATGSLALAAITAPGYLPYAPDLGRSGVRVMLARGQAIHGVTLLVYPAVDYQGLVVDTRGAPVAGAHVRVLGSPDGGATLESVTTEWKTGADGHFTFQAADDAMLEARAGDARGFGNIDRSVRILQKLRIQLGQLPPRDATITGHVRDPSGAPIEGAVVRGTPSTRWGNVASVFATTGPDGRFTLPSVDHASYDVSADAQEHIRGVRENVLGGSRNIAITLDSGLLLAGQVVDSRGTPVPLFTLVARRRVGAARPVVASLSLVDPQGRFSVRVPRGDYELLAAARGYARGTLTEAAAGATDVRIVLGIGATLRGKVIAADDATPIGNASVACSWFARPDLPRDAAGVLPEEPGTVTRPDGSFELTGISAGPLAIRVRAEGYHGRLDAAPTARDGAVLGPITIELTRVDPDEGSRTEMVGIGIDLSPDGDTLRVTRVLMDSSAFDAGIGFGDRVIAIDGLPVASLGLEGTLARIHGVAGTTVRLTLRRDGKDVPLVLERRNLRG